MQPKSTEELQTPFSPPGRSVRLSEFLEDLGPGLITGAADDDPSGISTYSVAGASYGYATLWTALLSFPLMAAIQLMCARLGMVTGCGLASVIRTRYSRWVLWFACSLVIVANVFNIGADLGGMADAMQMITGVRAYFWTPFFAALILGLLALDFVPDNGTRLQMADDGSVRLRCRGIPVPSPLERRSSERRSSRTSNGARITSRSWSEFLGPPSRPTSSFGRRHRKLRKIATTARTRSPKERVLQTKNSVWRREM